jgi:dolichol-phosphate mannosyltransferase
MTLLTVLIPCFNEAETVPDLPGSLLPELGALVGESPAPGLTLDSVELLFIDDGSLDGTLKLLRTSFAAHSTPGVFVNYASHPANLGLGAALRTGFAAAQGDVIVTTDSDGTYRFSEIRTLLGRLAPEVDLVTASPYHPSGGVENVSFHRLLFSRGASMVYRILLDRRIHTYTSLFRAYRRNVADVGFQSDGFLAVSELLVRARLAGYRLAEYPTVLHLRRRGFSKARLGRLTVAHLRFMISLLLHRLALIRP